jgi:DNA-binding transcriptional LysR family regulator
MEMIDPDLLKTFLAFVDGGSLARAAEIVHRSPSAVTQQMQRLNEIVGEPLIAPAGRGRSLTPAGEDLVGHARKILAAHRDAWLSLKGARADGRVAIGATQDFADSALPGLIRAFARSHPRVRLELRIGRSSDLSAAFVHGALDVLVTLSEGASPDDIGMLCEPMAWMASSEGLVVPYDEVPLALQDMPCRFHAAAVQVLESQGRAYRVTATSSSLAGLRAAVRGGVAVTLRTARWIEPGIALAPASLKLPDVGTADYAVRLRRDAAPAASHLAHLLLDGLSS